MLHLDEQGRVSDNAIVRFEGTRLEVVSDRPLTAWPAITVDGQSPENLDGCYQVSRASSVVTVPDWPALRRIILMHDHVAENWTAILFDFSPDQKEFTFAVQGSQTGPQGTGRSQETFVSNSHNLEIEPDDWMVERAWQHSKVALHSPFQVNWSVDYVCGGKPEVIDRGKGITEFRYVLATGLSDTWHSISLKDSAEDLGKIDHLTAYKPRIHSAELEAGSGQLGSIIAVVTPNPKERKYTMTREEAAARLIAIMRDVFDEDDLQYSDSLTADDVDGWDSLSHVRFLVAVEKEFSFRFTSGEIDGLKNIGEALNIIVRRASQ